jgi:hypothetical protein
MKKIATLLLVMISLVITPVLAGQCIHAHTAGFDTADTQQDAKQKGDENTGKKMPGNPAHLAHQCCGHASAAHPNPSVDISVNAIPQTSVVGMWKEARYDSRDVSPLLEPPSHA